MTHIPDVVQYPCDAESNSFFCALSTALLPVLGYAENTPYWCTPKRTYCKKCGACGEKTTLQKHHLSLYHVFLTATGIAFGFEFPEDDSVDIHSFEGVEAGWRWPDAFIDFIMDLTGLTWQRLPQDADRHLVTSSITASIDAGWPVLVRLGDELDWQVVTGYEGDVLYGLDSKAHTLSALADYEGERFVLRHWYDNLMDAIVITGHSAAAITLTDVLDRIIRTLALPSRDRLETDIMALIDNITPENAQETADRLNRITGIPIEARWHAAEAFCSRDTIISHLSEDDALKDRLADLFFNRYIANNRNETHGTCWKIWEQLNVGPESNYAVTPESGKRIQLPAAQAELKRLFAIVFDNDRAVLAELRDLTETAAG